MKFNNAFDELKNSYVTLKIIEKIKGNPDITPYYYYAIYVGNSQVPVGKISIRIGSNRYTYYNGNIGFEIDESFRGNHYAYYASLLVLWVAKYHGMKHIHITCDETNIASYKTIKKLGGRLLEVVIPPKDFVFYYEGMPPQRIYQLDL